MSAPSTQTTHTKDSSFDPCMMRRAMSASAFTLVELLVVIAILGVLISILMPSLSGARKLARRTQCLTQVRELYVAHTVYLMQEGLFPPQNNDELGQLDDEEENQDQGQLQYNYVIYDGKDFDQNFGPLLKNQYIGEIEQLYCPVQEDPYHSLATQYNPWPIKSNVDTRAAYARRYALSGTSYSRLSPATAVLADIFHYPKVIRTGHQTGVNAVFGDGHGIWAPDPGIFIDNELDIPFDALDNHFVREIWRAIEGKKEEEDQDDDQNGQDNGGP